mmetsp:Transcript_6621/g.10003  ORF Transcript_6621/g.10003 Transcript_6621/m.10003 type:complete len:93 (-) Transcript_6621:213-491(-)
MNPLKVKPLLRHCCPISLDGRTVSIIDDKLFLRSFRIMMMVLLNHLSVTGIRIHAFQVYILLCDDHSSKFELVHKFVSTVIKSATVFFSQML